MRNVLLQAKKIKLDLDSDLKACTLMSECPDTLIHRVTVELQQVLHVLHQAPASVLSFNLFWKNYDSQVTFQCRLSERLPPPHASKKITCIAGTRKQRQHTHKAHRKMPGFSVPKVKCNSALSSLSLSTLAQSQIASGVVRSDKAFSIGSSRAS